MKNLKILIGFVLSFIFIYFTVWKPQISAVLIGEAGFLAGLFGTTRVDFQNILVLIKNTSTLPLIICFLITPLHVFVRAHRWKLLLKPMTRLKTFDSYSLQMLGYLTNTIFPLRIGEIARGVLLARKSKLPNSTSIATVVLERLLDVLSLLLVFAIVSLLYTFPQGYGKAVRMMGFGTVGTLGIISYLVIANGQVKAYIKKLLKLFPDKVYRMISSTVWSFIDGFRVIKSSEDFPLIAVETIGLWLLYGLQAYAGFVAFGFHTDYSLISASPFIASLVVLAIIAVSLSIPSAPGGVGTFHAAAVFAMSLYGVPADEAAGFALVLHAVSASYYVGFGVLFLWREGMHFSDFKRLAD